jgi:hypothetical protein
VVVVVDNSSALDAYCSNIGWLSDLLHLLSIKKYSIQKIKIMAKKKEKVFWVRLKPFEPGKANYKFKPAVIKGLVYATDAAKATKKAIDEMMPVLKSVFPTADLKVLECKSLNADFSVTAN